MKKQWMSALALALAAAAVLSVPVCAADLATCDDFSDRKKSESKWTVDNFEPEDFDVSHGTVFLAVGDNGYIRNRPEDQKAKSYAMQGCKLKAGKVSSTEWTATVKLLVDDAWYGTRLESDIKKREPLVENKRILDNKKKVAFRTDLSGRNENPPAITFIKGGDGAPIIKYYDPDASQSWGTADFKWPEETASSSSGRTGSAAEPVDQWLTLTISFRDGAVNYYIDDQKIGGFTYPAEKAVPAYLALSMQNFERPDVSIWDDVCLYDGVKTFKKA